MAEAAKTVLITGASRGIGRATALLAAERGWSVAINYRSDQAMAEDTVDAIRKGGGKAEVFQGDVASSDDVERIFANAIEAFDQLDGVVVNAGVVDMAQPLAEMSDARLRRMIDTNVLGAMYCARAAANCLGRGKDEASASIVFLSSAAARLGSPFEYVDYAASKGAIDTLTIGLSKELADKNIRVNAVRPGLIETEIHASGGQPDRARRLGQTVPAGRPCTAAEVAEAVLWLCSDASSYTTGALIDVAGGR